MEGINPLHPVIYIASDNGCNEIFVDGRCLIHDLFEVLGMLIGGNDSNLISEGYLRVGDKLGREQGMGPAAVRTLHPADR